MNAREAIILNLTETRRRSIKLWRSLPDEWLPWRPDKDAMSFGEMIRHVWTGSYDYLIIVQNNGSIDKKEPQPYQDEPIVSADKEISMSETYFQNLISYVEALTEEELSTRLIDRSYVGYQRYLGDMLMRIAYHDSVHTGQFLQYMRMVGLERPLIWD
ncbi:DinB family protein [Brevibacillus sp. SYSU BS000544]|uniref:DinB family protein n=1 Tax=Brevibacillus sp. SYSU BS000544 TaxID=3416443 RepID=UPI003CE59077